MPLVSIILPSYNSRAYIVETLNSVRAQTFRDWECIIIDDCSTDGSADFVSEQIKDENQFVLIRLAKNKGVSNARNVGMKAGTGNFYAFLDSDDLWRSDKLEYQLREMVERGYLFSYTAYSVIAQNSKVVQKFRKIPGFLTLSKFLSQTAIVTSSVLVARKLCSHRFCPGPLFRSEDAVYWIKIFRQGHCALGIQVPLTSYRLTPGSLSRNKIRSFRAFWVISNKYSKHNVFSKLAHFSSYLVHALLKHSYFYIFSKLRAR